MTVAKSIFEDENGYLVVVSVPLLDLNALKITWSNCGGNAILKVICAYHHQQQLPLIT